MTGEFQADEHASRSRRAGFTVMEVIAATGVLTVAMLLVAQLGYWSLRERARTAARQVAIELAANVLEAARAEPWQSLDADWAAAQSIPEELADVLTEGRLAVRVEPEPDSPRTKRVVVEVRWLMYEEIESRPVRLIGLFAARSSEGEQP
jgi:hypothetical protein